MASAAITTTINELEVQIDLSASEIENYATLLDLSVAEITKWIEIAAKAAPNNSDVERMGASFVDAAELCIIKIADLARDIRCAHRRIDEIRAGGSRK